MASKASKPAKSGAGGGSSGKTPQQDARKKEGTSKPSASSKFSRPKPADSAPAPAPAKSAAQARLANLLNSNRNGMTSSHKNVLLILQNEPAWKGVFAFDEFTSQIVKVKAPPWLPEDKPSGDQTGPWVESDAGRLASWITDSWPEIRPTLQTIHESVRIVAEANTVHPVRDWLNGLKWNGKSRLDEWLITYAGAEDTPYVRAVGAMFMIGAVARIMRPGCKVDHTLVIEGKTGKGKSTLLRELVGEQWFLETEMDLGSKDFFQVLRGKWVLELAELDSLNKGELSKVKAVLTKRIDTYREAYGRYAKDHPRQCVFTGTTEEDRYLKDEKGNRRFWPVAAGVTGDIDIAGIIAARDQLWAEAVARYKLGEQWHLTDKNMIAVFEAEQEQRREVDPWEIIIRQFLHGSRFVQRGVETSDIFDHLQIEPAKRTRGEESHIGKLLKKLGWERRRQRVHGERAYLYKPVDELQWRVRKDPPPHPSGTPRPPATVSPLRPKNGRDARKSPGRG